MSDVHPEPGGSRPWALLAPDVADLLRGRLEQVVDEVTHGVTASVPAFATIDNPRFLRDVHEAVRVAVSRFVELAGADEPALTREVREAYVALGAAEAREDRGPDVLLGAQRRSARLLLRATTDALGRHRPVPTEEVIALADAIIAYVDELAAASTDGYALRMRELVGEEDRNRHRLAELLLGGGASESVVGAAAASIGWRSLHRVLPVLLPSAEAQDARFRFRAEGLVVERVDDVVAVLRGGPLSDRTGLTRRLRGRGAVVGPEVTWNDLPESVRLAELTARLVSEPGADPVFVDDHLATLAFQGEPSAMAALSRRRLAPFAGVPERQRELLLVTLQSWLRHWGSRSAVAEELFCHPQTVSYRIRRVREVLGADLDDPVARFELALVLADRQEALARLSALSTS